MLGAGALLAVGPGDVGASSATVELRETPTPATAQLPAGTALTWHNADSVRHRVRSVGHDDEFDSHDLEPGESYTHSFSRPGTYTYVDRRKETDNQSFGTVVVDAAAVPAQSQSPAAGAPSAPSTASVDVHDFAFAPATVTVAVGATVTFRNSGAASHTATARDGSFDVTVAPGASTTVTLARSGTYAYYCKFHPQMVGSITVVDAAATGAAQPAPPAGAAPPPTSRTSPAAAAQPVHFRGVAAALRDFRFTPRVVHAVAGRPVTWTNRGAAPHSVTALNGSFDSGVLGPGASWTHVFRRAGAYRFVCSIHPQMRAQLIVTARRDVRRRQPAPPAKQSGTRSRAKS